MIKSSVEAAAIPTFHYMDELYVDGLLHVRHLLKNDPVLAGSQSLDGAAAAFYSNKG